MKTKDKNQNIELDKVYKVIARKVNWDPPTQKFLNQRSSELRYIEENYLPRGSGFDAGCVIALTTENSLAYSKNHFTIRGEYHYMDDMGGYAGWFGFEIVITANLAFGFDMDFELTYNDTDESNEYILDMFEDYICESIHFCLNEDMPRYRILEDYSQFE